MKNIFILTLLCMFIILLSFKIIKLNSFENFADVSKCQKKQVLNLL